MNAAAKAPTERVRLVLITGLSGSGKSVVAKCLEDLGYYTVDNLPLALLAQFLSRPLELVPGHGRLAVVTDVRAPGLAAELPGLIAGIDRSEVAPLLIFLDASDEVLVRRFSETRRPHPLAPDQHVVEGIRRERELLADLRGRADRLLDTSQLSVHDVKTQIFREFSDDPDAAAGMVVSLVSFGFKHGIPLGTDLLFDVRYLPNPYFVPGLSELSGQDAAVREYLEGHEGFGELVGRLTDLLTYLLPRYRRENRSYLSVAIGCTGGRHRSVAVAESLRRALEENGWPARLIHRDIGR